MIGNVIVEIKTSGETIREIFKGGVSAENWSDTDRVIKECMLEVVNNSPYTFTGNTGNTLMEENGNVWTFSYEEV